MSKNEMIMLPREVVEQALEAWARGCPPDCKDGMTDSGGIHPWGEAALIECPSCQAVEALRAALEQPDAETPATAPEGWKLVPVEPTMSMQHAALIESRSHGPVSTGECNALPITYELGASAIVYRAMLDAAPKPPVLDQTQAEQEPYLYYDPENGDTWTQEAIDDGLRPPDGLIALYTK